ncbi:MAG: outer membrane beta-barrel protein [Candidatus Aminicenantes bacterium]|nr:outer membrane beta-barrel protein [Candidatus Aminicenantes bacterium]
MKTIKIFTIVLMALASLSIYSFGLGFRIGGSVNYYSVEDPIFKDTYGEGNLMYGISFSFEAIKKFELRAEANYFREQGKMTLTEEEITFTLRPVILGLRIKLVDVKMVSVYLGGGAGYYSYIENLPDRFEDIEESTIGYHAEAGVYVNVVPKFFLDFSVRYTIANAEPFDETIKLGGIRAGIGFGLSF